MIVVSVQQIDDRSCMRALYPARAQHRLSPRHLTRWWRDPYATQEFRIGQSFPHTHALNHIIFFEISQELEPFSHRSIDRRRALGGGESVHDR